MTKSITSASNLPELFDTDFSSFYPWLMTAFKKYKSICQLLNHAVILIETTEVLATLLRHCLRVFSTRHLRWLPCKSQAGRADKISTSWVDDNVGLQELSLSLSLSSLSNSTISSSCSCELLHVDAYPKGKLEKTKVCGFCFRCPRLPDECVLGPCRRRKSRSSQLD